MYEMKPAVLHHRPYQIAFLDCFPFGAIVAGSLYDVQISICVFGNKG